MISEKKTLKAIKPSSKTSKPVPKKTSSVNKKLKPDQINPVPKKTVSASGQPKNTSKASKSIAKPTKPKLKKPQTGIKNAKEKAIGKVTHYFDKVKVCVLKLSGALLVGDKIRIKGGRDTDFIQKVSSIEIAGEKIIQAKKGQEIGVKVKEKVRAGYKAFKIEE